MLNFKYKVIFIRIIMIINKKEPATVYCNAQVTIYTETTLVLLLLKLNPHLMKSYSV